MADGGSVDEELVARPAAPRGLRKRWLLAVYCLALAPALLTALTQPMWSRVDEAQHADVLDQYVHGVYPVVGVTTIRQPIVNVMQATGVFRWNLPGHLPLPSQLDASKFTPVPAGLTPYARSLWLRRHIWTFSYEAIQPPVFYMLAAPVWGVAEAVADPITAAYAVRVFNAMLLALLAPIVLAIAWLLFPGRRSVAVGSVLMVTALPGLVLIGTQISNDTSAAVAGALVTLVALKGMRTGWSLRWAALAGLTLGVAALCKLTAAGLAVPLALAILWPAIRHQAPLLRQVKAGALAAGVAALTISPWLAINLRIYGSILPTKAGDDLLGAVFPPSPPYPGYLYGSLRNAFLTFWTGEPFSQTPGHDATGYVMIAWAGLSVLGIALLLKRAGRSPWGGLLWIAVAAVIGEIVWALATLMVSGVGGYTPGRYLYPAVAPAVVLAVAGVWRLFANRRLRTLAMGVFVTLAAVNLGGLAAGVTGYAQYDRSGPTAAAAREQVNVSGGFHGTRIDVLQILSDPAAQAIWLEVRVSNSAATTSEWWPSPWVSTDGGATHVIGDYYGSSAFPEALPPHSVYLGWLKISTTGNHLDLRKRLRVHFLDIATDGYRQVGTILVWLPPAPH